MKHGRPAGMRGVPTTPPPSQAAPNPRYNDLTRPRSLQLDAAGASGGGVWAPSPAVGERCWSSCETAGVASSGRGEATTQNHELVHDGVGSLSDNRKSEMPLPWQGPIKLPDSDEEIMNAAQTWILQILHEHSENVTCEVGPTTSESLTDGRILCRVVNEITSGSVEVIYDVDTDESQVNNVGSFLEACRKFGMPEGALFHASDRDPKRVALCLYILSRVIQDTVPSFSGPFAVQPASTSSSRRDGSSSSSDDTSGSEHHSHHRYPGKLHPPQPPAYLPPSPDQRAPTMESWREQPHAPQRPSSLPSRLSRTSGGGIEASDGACFFASVVAGGIRQGDGGYRLGAHPGAPSVASTPGGARLHPSPLDRNLGSMVQQQQQQQQTAVTSPFTRTTANSLSPWLSGLNLGDFESALVGIGVETTGDLCYVEEQDLATIGMHRPQIRKFLQNRP